MKFLNWILIMMMSSFLFVACEKNQDDEVTTKEPEITVTPIEPAAISSLGGRVVLNLKTNRSWTVSSVPDWFTVTPTSGEASLYSQNVAIEAEENKGGARQAVLTFSIEGISVDVTIKQSHPFGPDAPANAIFFESFETSIGDFTIDDVKVPSEMSCVWEHSSQYKCMKGTAYSNSSNYDSESWLISPEISLEGYQKAFLTFEHAGGYFGTPSDEATLWVSEKTGEWEQFTIDDENYPTSWSFITAGNWDMTQYAGKKIKIAFKYSSTSTKAGTWEIRNVSLQSGSYEDTVIPAIDPTKTSWMELPATDSENLGYYAHRFSMDEKIYRNFTFAWSQDDLVSLWVAYPLCKTYTNKIVKRSTDAWRYDPILGKEKSAAPFSYYAGDYARGHQLPSADRLCCTEANKQTFYGSNIAPQLNEHNEGIWVTLENYVRDIANASDTTYVVTGCVVEGSDEITTDSDDKNITVPVAFYKALLRYEKGAETEWTGAAFYTEHKDYGSAKSDLKAVSMSIDDLEKKTGLDFFVNLVDKLGQDAADAVEAKKPSDDEIWGL